MKKSPVQPGSISRRTFFQAGAVGAVAAIAAPMIVPSRLFGSQAPSNRIRVGQIGAGRIALGHDMPGVINTGIVDIVAVADVDSKRTQLGKIAAQRMMGARGTPVPEISTHADFQEMMSREDIDAIVISTPDHWHAEQALAAVLAGKDVYLQKPMTMTHAEGVLLRDAVERTGRIFQIGSQQRSWGPREQFRRAVELVRSGRVGNLQRVEIGLPTDPTKEDDPEMPIPANLDYDRWLGPTPHAFYTEQRVHSQALDENGLPNVGPRPGWLRNENYCLGMITGWGTHHFDTAHWGMDLEHTGPARVEGTGEFPPRDRIWNVHGAYNVQLVYPGNILMEVSDRYPNGIRFIGDEGWIFVSRDAQAQTASDPTGRASGLRPLDASDERLLDPQGLTVQLLSSTSHHQNWIDCVQSRQTPLASAPVGHRSNTACILSWIAMRLQRPLTWDADAERFVGDDEANAMLTRPEREPYGAFRFARAKGII